MFCHGQPKTLIENLWRELKTGVRQRNPKNLQEVKDICQEEWMKISEDEYKKKFTRKDCRKLLLQKDTVLT